MKTITSSLALFVVLTVSGAAQAALVDRGGGLIYDSDLNITWLANANLAATETFGLARNVDLDTFQTEYFNGSYIYNDGTMTWGGTQKWISAMNVANYLGYNDWRLPTVTDIGAPGCQEFPIGSECGFNVPTATSAMAHLFYDELGNKAIEDTAGLLQVGYGLVNKGLFNNFQPYYYWSGSVVAVNSASAYVDAWYFNFATGWQGDQWQDFNFYALPFRSGDVSAVPVPAAAWLLGSGLLGLIGVARKRQKQPCNVGSLE